MGWLAGERELPTVPAVEIEPARLWLPIRRGRRSIMGFGRGVLLWLLGVPIPIILLLAMCSHH